MILWNHLLDFVCLSFCDQAHNVWKTNPASVLLAAFPELDCMFPTIRKRALRCAIVWLAASGRWGAMIIARSSLLTCGQWAKDLFYLLVVYLSILGWPCQGAWCNVFCRASSTEREWGNYFAIVVARWNSCSKIASNTVMVIWLKFRRVLCCEFVVWVTERNKEPLSPPLIPGYRASDTGAVGAGVWHHTGYCRHWCAPGSLFGPLNALK